MKMEMPAPLFSVIIPTYNRAGKVVRALKSVLAQTLADYEVWVVDDGSSDATAEALAPYMGKIHYLPIPNSGVSNARNTGIRESSGRYIAFLDSDDVWHPQKLECYARAVQSHPRAGLFYSQIKIINEAGKMLWVDKSRAVDGSGYLSLLMGNFIATSSAVARRSSLPGGDWFDGMMSPCEDWDLWLRVARQNPICLVPAVLADIEYAPQDRLTSRTEGWLQAHDRVIEKVFGSDPSLSPGLRRAVQANVAFIKGRICLSAGDESRALEWFSAAARMDPGLVKARLYCWVLKAPALRRLLPGVVVRRLRLPEAME